MQSLLHYKVAWGGSLSGVSVVIQWVPVAMWPSRVPHFKVVKKDCFMHQRQQLRDRAGRRQQQQQAPSAERGPTGL